MIITHLISTLLVCVGVATGNVSSNAYKGGNSFNYANKIEERKNPEPKRGQESLTFTYTLKNEVSFNENFEGYQYKGEAQKYYINNQVTTSTNLGNIYNTVYIYNRIRQNAQGEYTYMMTSAFHYYEITPYITSYGTEATINIKLTATWYNHTVGQDEMLADGNFQYFIGLINENHYQEARQHIDMTNFTPTSQGIPQMYATSPNYYIDNNKYTYHNYQKTFTSGVAQTQEINFTIGNIQDNVMLYLYAYISIDPASAGRQTDRIKQTLTNMQLSGYINDINYEVIDLPGLMYDVITMPFSFISQGFNLTLFPGTPYALNIGNVIITIIAVSLLMFILRKVLH